MESLYKNIQLILELLKAPFLVLKFSYYTLMIFLMMLFVMLLSMLMTLLSTLSVIKHLWQQLELPSELGPDLRDTVDWDRKWLVDFNPGKTQMVSFDQSNNTGAIDVKMDGSVLEEKSSFKMLGLNWGSFIISITETASKKIGALIHSMKFHSPKVVLYLYKSTIWPCMEYCCDVWAGAPSC